MSNQSYDLQVKDILDRVAKGHLSSEEAATLIAAIKPTASADAGDTSAANGASTQEPVADDVPSPAAWADAVDSPTAEPKSDPVAEPKSEPTARHAGEPSVVQDSVVDDVVDDAEAEPVEEEHSNVPVPAGVQRVTVRAIGRRVRLIGEPAVNGVAVDGPHVIKRDGDTLAISSEGDMGVSIDGFSMLRNPTDLKAHVNGLAKELSIRVNPSLQVEVEVTGGSVNAERLPGLTRVRVTAGTAKVTDVDGPIDVLVQAGSADLDAQITKGRSRVRVESGTAKVSLRRGSDVHVHTEAQLGRVTWAGAVSGQSKDVEIGRGRAALDVEVLVGTAQIVSD
ncbi:hypothetical protein [Kribbella kalugense]|uniref:Adhesin n=1 Tax=Kribbella kalugense TaxID=2512221 RepID=A0A4R7ZET7_9ACTN|nr:hypothetical protein [Kribbella kalugense]TDW15595.1 hypothetical protein EV650_7083 [Kribbella kalugense]